MKKEHDDVLNNALSGLSRVTIPIADDSEILNNKNQSSFRDGLMEDILRDNPGLTYEELDRQMSAFGF